jgi:hypothetical protein
VPTSLTTGCKSEPPRPHKKPLPVAGRDIASTTRCRGPTLHIRSLFAYKKNQLMLRYARSILIPGTPHALHWWRSHISDSRHKAVGVTISRAFVLSGYQSCRTRGVESRLHYNRRDTLLRAAHTGSRRYFAISRLLSDPVVEHQPARFGLF